MLRIVGSYDRASAWRLCSRKLGGKRECSLVPTAVSGMYVSSQR